MRPVALVDSIAEGEALVGTTVRPASPVPRPAAQKLSVQFPFASARLGPAARDALRGIAPQLGQATEVRLSGRTDSTGPAAANDVLAKDRAEAVRRELLALVPGIAPALTVEAQGACCFIESNDRAEGRARNRRVDIVYRLDLDDPP
ncbi:OmpA family protein [Xenophilus azovorans]|uniref:OmpA family protein n=1 Tax=Xenophilus azovorans TaxID=151755 RepID=UPI001FE18EC2|nr:OmpA family protein [Xenophilus azovorans]